MRFAYTDGNNKDFIQLCALLDDSLNDMAGGESNRSQYIQYNALADIHDVFIAYDGEEPVACGSFKHCAEGVAEVKRVFVKPSHRGSGLSKKLMAKIEAKAGEMGYERLILETGRAHLAAVALYRGIGYDEIPNYGQYRDMPRSICFEKRL